MYQKILVAVDGSTASGRGITEALKVAGAVGGQILFLHVVSEPVTPDIAPSIYLDKLLESLREAGAKILEETTAMARRAGVPCESKMVERLGGRPADEIVREARSWRADLIVLGTHGRRGLKRLALGSDAELVLRQSPAPVLTVRDQPEAAH